MYSIQIGEFAVQCNTADEVRALCGGSANGIAERTVTVPHHIAAALATPARRKYRRKATDTRGKSMSQRWEKARRYAKRHDVTPSEAFKILSK
jgi:hypothetical protein